MRSLLRTAALLTRIARLRVGPDHPRIRRRPLESATGLEGDVWEPRDGAGETLIAVHGASLSGKEECRLQAFARAVAASGVRCLVPNVRGLSRMAFVAADAADLAALASETAARHAPPALLGFSLGGSCALLAAARAGASVKYVVTFGAAHDYGTLFDEMTERWREVPQDPHQRRERIYVSLLMAYRQAVRSGDAEEVARLESPLRRFCPGLPPQEQAELERQLEALAPIAAERRSADRAALRLASPAGQLGGLTCPTGIIHDPGDALVPMDHARRLIEELQALGTGAAHRLLVTSMLDHVDLSTVRLADVATLVRIIQPVVSASRTAA